MTDQDDGERASPTKAIRSSVFDDMSLRQYAAIELRVPDSELDWLNDMIREARRLNLAGIAMQGLLTNSQVHLDFRQGQIQSSCQLTANAACSFAEGMIDEWKKRIEQS